MPDSAPATTDLACHLIRHNLHSLLARSQPDHIPFAHHSSARCLKAPASRLDNLGKRAVIMRPALPAVRDAHSQRHFSRPALALARLAPMAPRSQAATAASAAAPGSRAASTAPVILVGRPRGPLHGASTPAARTTSVPAALPVEGLPCRMEALAGHLQCCACASMTQHRLGVSPPSPLRSSPGTHREGATGADGPIGNIQACVSCTLA